MLVVVDKDELERLSAENDRLIDACEEWIATSNRLGAENAKLRSLATEVAGILFNLDVDRCGLCDRDSINHPCPAHTTKGGECLIKNELRKLGVIR